LSQDKKEMMIRLYLDSISSINEMFDEACVCFSSIFDTVYSTVLSSKGQAREQDLNYVEALLKLALSQASSTLFVAAKLESTDPGLDSVSRAEFVFHKHILRPLGTYVYLVGPDRAVTEVITNTTVAHPWMTDRKHALNANMIHLDLATRANTGLVDAEAHASIALAYNPYSVSAQLLLLDIVGEKAMHLTSCIAVLREQQRCLDQRLGHGSYLYADDSDTTMAPVDNPVLQDAMILFAIINRAVIGQENSLCAPGEAIRTAPKDALYLVITAAEWLIQSIEVVKNQEAVLAVVADYVTSSLDVLFEQLIDALSQDEQSAAFRIRQQQVAIYRAINVSEVKFESMYSQYLKETGRHMRNGRFSLDLLAFSNNK
jgi:hypothetical protein